MSPAGSHALSFVRHAFRPSLGDCIVAALTLWLLATTLLGAGGGLLLDSATGCHIRTGEYILEHGSVPRVDPFSFTKEGQPWFAWEWLADVLFGAAYQAMGMQAIVVLCATTIAVTAYGVVRYCLWSGGDAFSSLILFQFWVGASSIHFLARPHIFTLLFMVAALWLIEYDRRRPTRLFWLLVPLTVVWVNLHGGFVAVIVSLFLLAAGSFAESVLGFRDWQAARRYLAAATACLAASLVNPYGVEEHRHLVEYLSAGWIRQMVEEFQSPRFQNGDMLYYEALLLAGVLMIARLLARREIASAMLLMAWAHASLTSVRHIPIFAIVCAPMLAREMRLLRDRWIASGTISWLPKILASLGSDHHQALARLSAWSLVPCILFLAWPFPADRFRLPEAKFPTTLVDQQRGLISNSRVFTLDSWADYLTYRNYPKQRVFVDGRSDFFGKELSERYLQVLNGQRGWDDVLRRYRVDLILVPEQSSVASLLRLRSDWNLVGEADGASLFRLVPATPKSDCSNGPDRCADGS
jgi:hypothetical protein